MPSITFRGFWSEAWQKDFKVPRGYLLVKPVETYIRPLGAMLKKLTTWQNKKEELRELKFTLEIHYKKRTLDQNALMWSLYHIEANELNGGMKGGREMVTTEQLYENDLKEHAPRLTISVPVYQAEYIRREYRIASEEIVDNSAIEKNVKLHILLSTSHFDTRQMAEWIDMLFNRIAENGVTVTNPGEIQDYWVQWRQHLNDNKILLHEEKITQNDYKALNPICEAHGADCFLGNGGGSLHHIKARGMGGNPEDVKEYPSNWLHLCDPAHMELESQGVESFVKKYPHLKYKIYTALKRD